MKIKKVSIGLLKNAHNVISSDKYFIAFTGAKAHIFNKKLELIKTITNLKNVHNGQISYDQTKVLFVSISNVFYVYDLTSFECVFKYQMKGKYNYNLEGAGIWRYDNTSVIIRATDKKAMRPCLMTFNVEKGELIFQKDMLDYTLLTLKPMPKYNCYAFVGHKWFENNTYITYFETETFTEYQIEGFDDKVMGFEYNEFLDQLIIYGHEYSMVCDYYGKMQKNLNTGYIRKNEHTIFNALANELSVKDKKAFVDAMVRFINEDETVKFEVINKICWSSDCQYVFVATSERFFVYDNSVKDIVFSVGVDFGAYDIVELDEKVAISTWNGVIVYQITR